MVAGFPHVWPSTSTSEHLYRCEGKRWMQTEQSCQDGSLFRTSWSMAMGPVLSQGSLVDALASQNRRQNRTGCPCKAGCLLCNAASMAGVWSGICDMTACCWPRHACTGGCLLGTSSRDESDWLRTLQGEHRQAVKGHRRCRRVPLCPACRSYLTLNNAVVFGACHLLHSHARD